MATNSKKAAAPAAKKAPKATVVLSQAQKLVLKKTIGSSLVSAFSGFGVKLPSLSRFKVQIAYGTTWDSIVANQKDATDGKFHRFCPVSCILLDENNNETKQVFPSSLYCGNVKLEEGERHPLENIFAELGTDVDLISEIKLIGITSDDIEKTSATGVTYKVTYLSLIQAL